MRMILGLPSRSVVIIYGWITILYTIYAISGITCNDAVCNGWGGIPIIDKTSSFIFK